MTDRSDSLATPWYRGIRPRLRAYQRAKAIGVPACIAVFFVFYFLLLAFPVFPVTVMPMTALDRWIGFQPRAFWLYASLWFYISLPVALLNNSDELRAYLGAALAMALSAMAIYLVVPTTIPADARPGGLMIDLLKTIDSGRNACPSLHVAFSMFSALWLDWSLQRIGAPRWTRVLSGCWCLGIVYSALAIKQHVVLDALAGLLLGLLTALLHRRHVQRALGIAVAGPVSTAATRRSDP